MRQCYLLIKIYALILPGLTKEVTLKTTPLTSKGQVVIPKAIREDLQIRTGTEFTVTSDGACIVLTITGRKAHRLADWPGFERRIAPAPTERLCAPVDLNEP